MAESKLKWTPDPPIVPGVYAFRVAFECQAKPFRVEASPDGRELFRVMGVERQCQSDWPMGWWYGPLVGPDPEEAVYGRLPTTFEYS